MEEVEMTVKELIDDLKKMPDDAPVLECSEVPREPRPIEYSRVFEIETIEMARFESQCASDYYLVASELTEERRKEAEEVLVCAVIE